MTRDKTEETEKTFWNTVCNGMNDKERRAINMGPPPAMCVTAVRAPHAAG